MKAYRRVTAEDRFQLKTYLNAGLNQSEISVKLGFSKATISRELSRNMGLRGYRYKQAQSLSSDRQAWRSDARKLNKRLISSIERLLAKKWSPLQISNRLRLERKKTVSHETIYRHIYGNYTSGGRLYLNLRFSHRKRKPRFPRRNKDRRGIIQKAESIESRGSAANNRSQYGHWERDTMFGKDRRNSVLLIVDRKARYVKLGKLTQRTAKQTLSKTKELLRRLPKKTMTNDRGHEFSDHIKLKRALKIPVYFCHPYTSCERGTAENRIGILRQYLKKGTNLKTLKQTTLTRIENEINNRPMKCLDWRTPIEVLFKKNVALTM